MTVLRSEQPCKGVMARYTTLTLGVGVDKQTIVHAHDKSEARALLKKHYRDEKVPEPWDLKLALLSRGSKEKE